MKTVSKIGSGLHLVILLIPMLLVARTGLAGEDHSEFFEDPFDSPQEVTETCLGCHEDAATEVMATKHWTWKTATKETVPGYPEKVAIGKANVFNNYCIGVPSNWPRCTSCHAGYGWKDADFDFDNQENVDCLVCHDQSGQYIKEPTGAGMPKEGVDLLKAAQSVGKPTRKNCGVCHFYGGGGDGVKHGDLDSSLNNPSAELDVHMGGQGMVCTDCHTTDAHQIAGRTMTTSVDDKNQVSCLDCHDSEPHESASPKRNEIINNHTAKVACQACHIPRFARGGMPTKMYWDWSQAGQDIKAEEDEYGKHTYAKKKGKFVWEANVRPEYAWYNGKADHYLLGETFDPAKVLTISRPMGDRNDPNAKLFPFKVHRGKQIYDSKNNYLIQPHLFGKGGYWKTFDWNKAAETGMKAVGLPYSGSYDFVETEMYWPITHMVAPADQALKCTDCHGRRSNLDWQALGYDKDPIKK